MLTQEQKTQLTNHIQALREVAEEKQVLVAAIAIQAARLWEHLWPEQSRKLVILLQSHLPGEKGGEKAFKEDLKQFLDEAEEALKTP